MLNTSKELVKEMNDMKEVYMEQFATSEMFDYMDEEVFALLKRSFKIMDLSGELIVQQAELMEQMNKNLELLLQQNKGS